MIQFKQRKIGILFGLVCLSLMIAISFFEYSYADAGATGDEEEITVYLTINDENGYVVGNDDAHTVMYRVPIKLSYVDLADYGMEKYYRYRAQSYEEGGNYLPEAIENKDIVKQPTVLMLYLKALSLYYLDRPITKADINDEELKALCYANQAPTSFFMNYFWGHNMNLLYYVNNEYPLMRDGWGATADYILLEDGDSVRVQLMPGMEINSFQRFDKEEIDAVQGTTLNLNLQRLGSNIYTGSGTSSYPLPDYYIRYSMDYGKTWNVTEIQSDVNGDFTFIPEEAGVCYLSTQQYRYTRSYHCGLPTSIIHITPKKVQNTDCYTDRYSRLHFSFDEIKGAEGYNISYREQGAQDWSTVRTDTNDYVLATAESGIVYEFKASAYVTDKYTLPGEPYITLNGEESDIISYSLPEDSAVMYSIEKIALVTDLTDIQLSDREVIEDARNAYDALDDEQKKHIAYDDIEKLIAAEERLAELQAEKDARDKQEATAVTNMITALPSAANITLDDEAQVLAAYDAYQALSPEGKALIKTLSLNKLNSVKAKLDELLKDKARQEAAEISSLIKELPDITMVSLSDKQDVQVASNAYNKLSELAKSYISENIYSKLSALIEKINELQKKADEEAAKQAYKAKLISAKISKAKTAKTKLTVKALKKCKAKLTWKKSKFSYTVDGKKFTGAVTGYRIYRAKKKNGKYKLVKTITKAGTLKYTDKGLKKGKKYCYKIKPYTKISGENYIGKWSNIVNVKTKQ